MIEPRRFGGFGNLYIEGGARRANLLYAGEAAGFQDALFGFGMRYALLSGHLAARAWMDGRPERYDWLWRGRLAGLLQLAVVNRYLYERLGNAGYVRLLRRINRAQDARDFLRRWYASGTVRRWLHRYASWRIAAGRRKLTAQCREGCDCTWCRCWHDSSGG